MTEDSRVVSAAQPSIRGDHQQDALLFRFALLQQRVRNGRTAFLERLRQVCDDLRHLLRVGRRLRCAVHRLLEASGRDQFHRPRDLADVANGLQPFDDRSCFGHESLVPDKR